MQKYEYNRELEDHGPYGPFYLCSDVDARIAELVAALSASRHWNAEMMGEDSEPVKHIDRLIAANRSL